MSKHKKAAKRYRAYFLRSEQLAYQTSPADTSFLYAAKNQYTGKVSWHRTYDNARAAAGVQGEVVNALCEAIE